METNWEARARELGWAVAYREPQAGNIEAPEPICLYHMDLDREWPLGDWKGAVEDVGGFED